MGKKQALDGGFGKTGKKVVPGAKGTKEKRQAQPGLAKDAAASFLKQRLGKKLRELCPASAAPCAGAGGGFVAPAAAVVEALSAIGAEAEKRGCEFARQVVQAPTDSFIVQGGENPVREAENTRKRFYAELRKVLAAADVVIEVLDARDPASCRSFDLEREVTGAGKRLILLLNKIDLVPKPAVEAWILHLKRSFPAIAFKAAHGGARRPKHAMTSLANAPDGLLQSTHAVVGADELMQLLKNYSRMGDGKSKSHVTVGIVGYPNTGKSSVINSMKRYCAVEVGGKAGITKVMQEVQLDSKVTLIDTPGIVFEGASSDPSVVLRNVVRVENVADPVAVVDAMLRKAPRQAVLKFYGLEQDFSLVMDFLVHVAQTRGKLRRGSGLDIPTAARSVISDWTTGKFRYYALPPTDSQAADASATAETAEIVPVLAKELDIEALFSGEGVLPEVLGAPTEPPEGADDVNMAGDGEAQVEVDMEP